MSLREDTPAPRPTRNAPWQKGPDAKPRPNRSEYSEKLSAFAEQRRALIEEVKKLQSSVARDGPGAALNAERTALREKLNEIDVKRRVLRECRAAQDSEIGKRRKQRDELAEKLRTLQAELGGFSSVQEIDQAIAYMMRKMESTGGTLTAEKRNRQQLSKLEQAKTYLLQLQPLQDAIKDLTEQETVLQQEHLAISEQIGIFNKEYDEELQKKRNKDKEAQGEYAGRSEVYKQCDEIRASIDEVSKTMDGISAERDRVMREWEVWNDEAREKYFEEQTRQREELTRKREERQREYEERRDAHKIAAKKERAAKRQNPHIMEISTCATLIQYLHQKKMMVQQEEEAHQRREAAANFDPSQAAPAGCVVLNEGKWSDNKPLNKAAKKQQKQQQRPKSKPEEPVDAVSRTLHHPEDKIRLFHLIEVDPTLTIDTIDAKIKQVEAQKTIYESHIQTGKMVLSSGEEDEEGEEEPEKSGEQPEVGEAAPKAE